MSCTTSMYRFGATPKAEGTVQHYCHIVGSKGKHGFLSVFSPGKKLRKTPMKGKLSNIKLFLTPCRLVKANISGKPRLLKETDWDFSLPAVSPKGRQTFQGRLHSTLLINI